MKKVNVTHLNYSNITELKPTLQYEELFHHALEGILIVNEGGKIEYMNPAYEKLFGVSRHTFTGKGIHQVPNDDLLLASLKTMKKLQGFINTPFINRSISASASPIWKGDEYKGVMAIYREEASTKNFTFKPQEEFVELKKAFNNIIGNNPKLKKELKIAERASNTRSTILINGESGTGKELVASAIHESSPYSGKPFVKVNCGAIPANLLESELFGHEQGAFTGAIKRRIGKFEQANEGTIFLDEIGDMPLEMQVKLLRVIQDKKFERVGGSETLQCNLRIIAATHRDLKGLVETGKFREDLYYRLNVIPIQLPPLRERKEDILELSDYFVVKISKRFNVRGKKISQGVKDAFLLYDWSGNIREMENLMERLMVLVEGDEITLEDIPDYISHVYNRNVDGVAENGLINLKPEGEMALMEEYEREMIALALKRYGSFNAAGKVLGISHKTVAFKARKYQLLD
ncbi:sigma-54 interaction domain-containing protein [Alkaliphilus transvaalensis]|uniref:sigma-54 interaction domain-containing protein n=1 Tax=Alkaliphilus transvaalensis TaxID=114628 RepID=UPI000686054C|nr:sigma 54-interacting transcriptional regulator [Alkaliphilus transvaalensis]